MKPQILSKGVESVLIGKDAIGAWVNASNPVTDLSLGQLQGIFTGKIVNWSQVGDPDPPIHV